MQKAQSAYFPHIDALRAIAVIAVIIYHLNPGWLPGGFAGVDVFFVISGFIVSASIGSLAPAGLHKFILFFYARRLLRIAPALIVCMLVTCAATAILIPTAWLSDANQRTGLYAFAGLSNFILAKTSNDYFSPLVEFNPYTHTWSLGVEEQFYFIFPLLFFAWNFSSKWRRATIAIFAAAFVGSLAYSAWLGHTDKTSAYYMITSRFWQLAAGVLLFQLMTIFGRRFDTNEQAAPRWFPAAAIASLIMLAYGLITSKPNTFPYPGSIPTVLGTLGLLGFLHGQPQANPLIRALSARPLLYIGRISYSLYLWHWPVFVMFRWTTGTEGPAQQISALVMAVLLAIASYHFVETSVRYHSAPRRMPRYAIVIAGIATVAFSAWLSTRINRVQSKISISAVTRHAPDWYPHGVDINPDYPGCTVQTIDTPIETGIYRTYTRQNCTLPVTGPRIYAIGDSHAIGYAGMYKGYVMQTGATVVVYNNGGHPYISLQPHREEAENSRANAKAATENLLGKIQPGDILFLPSKRLPRFADQWIRFSDEHVRDAVFGESATKARAKAVKEAETLLRRFREKGANIVFEAPKPIFKSPTYRCVETYNRSNPICASGTTVSRSELEALRTPVVDALRQLSLAVPGTTVWDPFPVLCPVGKECSAFRDQRPLFFDADHVSGYGNQLLISSFRDHITNRK